MMSFINETDFVIENKELVYPEIVTDGLQLYYDAKGKRDTDYHRDTMLDMSGNKNHGKLHNFAYEKHSGYKDGLVFDYIDDKLVRPELDLKPNDFTFMLNGNIISFSPDGTVKRVQDGEVIENKGFNLVRNGNMSNGTSGYLPNTLINLRTENNELVGDTNDAEINSAIINSTNNFPRTYQNNHKYYLHIKKRHNNYYTPYSFRIRLAFGTATFEGGTDHHFENQDSIIVKCINSGTSQAYIGYLFGSTSKKEGFVSYIKDLMVIDLTEAFGASNEPTKEQMDEIIQRFGFIPNAQDLIDRIEYKGNDLGDMENIIDGLYKTEVLSGEEIYTDKADDDAVVHVEVDGKSVGGGSGKNLIIGAESNDWGLYGGGKYSIKTYESGERIIRAERNGSAIAWGVQQSGNSQKMILETGETYRVSFDVRGDVSILNYVYIMNVGAANENISSTTLTVDSKNGFNRVSATFMKRDSTAKHSYLMISTQELDGTWFEVKNIQIEKSSSSISYEPPAPNPDYPIEIHSLNDFDMVSSKGRRNLSVNRANEITNNVTNDRVADISFGEFELDASQPYTISFDLKVDKGAKYLNYNYLWSIEPDYHLNTSIGSISVIDDNEWHRYSHTFSFPQKRKGIIRVAFDSRQSSVDSGVPFSYKNLKLEKGSQSTSYSVAPELMPYDMVENDVFKTNLLLDEPLRSVGDVKDRLFRDSDGVWKIERKVWAQVLDKNTVLNSSGASSYEGTLSTNRYISPSKSSLGYGTSTHELCTHLPHKDQVWTNDDLLFGTSVNGPTQYHFRLPNDITGVVSGDSVGTRTLKISAWLESEKNNGNPFTVQYKLRDPEIEILDQPLQDKLNNLRSFEDSNYVYTVLPNENNNLSENLKPTLHAKFLYNNWYKEDRVINNLMIYNRALTNQEMLQNYKTIKRRWGM